MSSRTPLASIAPNDGATETFVEMPSAPMREKDACGAGAKARALNVLRERIARIEGIHLHRLDVPSKPRHRPTIPAKAERSVTSKSSHATSELSDRDFGPCPFGIAEEDEALAAGFPGRGLTEIHVDETRGSGTGAGFAVSLAVLFGASARRPVLWIGSRLAFSEAGMPYLPGLVGHGLDPSAIVLVRTRTLAQALWAGEEAARSRAVAMTILEVRGNPSRLSLEGTRRLHFRAREAGAPFLLLRQSGRAEATAAPLRLRIVPEPAAPVPDLRGEPDDPASKLIGNPVFRLTVEKARDGRAHSFILEWNPHERRFHRALESAAKPLHGRLPAVAADRQDQARASGQVVALRRAS